MITVFTKNGCPYCTKATALLDSHNIQYGLQNVTESKTALKFLKEAGHKTVPQIYNVFDLLVEGGYDGLAKLSKEEILGRMK